MAWTKCGNSLGEVHTNVSNWQVEYSLEMGCGIWTSEYRFCDLYGYQTGAGPY